MSAESLCGLSPPASRAVTGRLHARYAAFGLLMGLALAYIGFSDFAEVHRMFTFADLRLLFTFMGAVALSALVFLLARRRKSAARRLHPGIVPGALLFGAGWALTGACPSIALVQLGEGKLFALLTLGGVLFGAWLYGKVHARFFRWDPGSCDEP